VSFFGRPTGFVVGPTKLAIKYKCPVVSIFVVRINAWEYRILSNVILTSGHQEEDELKVTQMFATEIENNIRLYPEQWTWNYKRWKFDDQSVQVEGQMAEPFKFLSPQNPS
jgi:KDO2-lipid IV(A) lauroyltransferase